MTEICLLNGLVDAQFLSEEMKDNTSLIIVVGSLMCKLMNTCLRSLRWSENLDENWFGIPVLCLML